MSRRVVITALGVVSPLGMGIEPTLASFRASRDGTGPVTLFDVEGARCQAAGEIPEVWLQISGGRHGARRLHRAARMMIHALRQVRAMDPGARPGRALIATTSGGMSLGEHFLESLHGIPLRLGVRELIANYTPQKPVQDALQDVGLDVPFDIVANACASGSNAIGEAFHLVASGRYDSMLCGGYDALARLVFCGFDCLQASTAENVRPFDRGRTGLVLGEGAALFHIEERDSALARGVPILAEIHGYGISTDNYHLTQPNPNGEGPLMAMQRAVADAGIAGSEIGYVNAHGTATRFNDATEAIAIAAVCADALVSSTKSMMGHSLGAAGAIEAAFTVLALREGLCPPNLHFRETDENVALHVVPEPRAVEGLKIAASNSFGFGGTNATVVLGRADEGIPSGKVSAPLFGKSFIAGMGWVNPLGNQLTSVWEKLCAGEVAAPTPLTLGEGNPTLQGYRIPDSLVAHLGTNRRLRRASPISYFGVAAGLSAIADAGLGGKLDPSRTAIVFAVATGSVQYTRRFYEGILRDGVPGASPLLFPETVYNAPASHLAATLGISGATLTLVGDASVGFSALQFGATLLDDPAIDHVLVVGAEECDYVTSAAYQRWGMLSPEGRVEPGSGNGTVLSDGGAAVLLARQGRFEVNASGGHACSFRGGSKVFESVEHAPSLLIAGLNGCRLDDVESGLLSAHFPGTPFYAPKIALGDSVGASALTQVICGCLALRQGAPPSLPIPEMHSVLAAGFGLNRQAGYALLRPASGM